MCIICETCKMSPYNGWILCPSNRFPGKFYYYNVLNGESVWSFVDSEKKQPKPDDKTQCSYKCHSYPEPTTPPDQGLNNVFLSQSKFGKAIFPKYINESDIPDSPIKKQISVSDIKKVNKNTQTCSPNDNIIEKKPIYNFGNYQHTNKIFDISIIDNPFKNVNIYSNKKNLIRKSNLNINLPVENIQNKFIDPFLSAYDKIKSEINTWKNFSNPLYIQNKNTKSAKDINQMDTGYSTETSDNDLRNISCNKDIEKNAVVNSTTFFDNKDKNETDFDNFDSFHNITNNKITFQNNEDQVDNCKYNEELHTSKRLLLDKNDLRHKLYSKKRKLDRILPCKEKKVRFDSLNKNRNEECIDAQRENECEWKNNLFLLSINDKSNLNKNSKDINNEVSREKAKSNWMNLHRTFTNDLHKNIFLQKADDLGPFIINEINTDVRGTNAIRTYNKEKYDTNNDQKYTLPSNTNQYLIDKELYNINKRTKELHIIEENIDTRLRPNYQKRSLLKNKNVTISQYRSPYSNSSSTLHITNERNNLNCWYKFDKTHTCDENIKFGNQFNQITKEDLNLQKYINNEDDNTNLNMFESVDVFKNLSMVDVIKRLYASDIDQKVYVKIGELICCYTQIMEDFIYRIIETSVSPPPYSLSEVLLKLQSIFHELSKVSEIVTKIFDLDIFCPKTGYIKANTRPKVMLKAVCYGVLLVGAFKEHGVNIEDTEESFRYLLLNIENPLDLELPQPPASNGESDVVNPRYYFIKKRSEVVKYLEKHYPEGESYVERSVEQDGTHNQINGKNVLRTTGKDLQLIKINNKNQLIFEKKNEICSEERSNIIDNDEKKLQINKLTDDKNDKFDNSELNSIKDTHNEVEKNKKTNTKMNVNNDIDKFDDNVIPNDQNIDGSVVLNTESEQVYLFMKMFLMELSSTLQLVYTFIEECSYQFSKELDMENKNAMYEEARDTYEHLEDIINNLKSIIERENQDDKTMKYLVLKAVGAAEDKRVTIYQKIIEKCLEQAGMLESSLKVVLKMSDHSCNMSLDSEVRETYINIFE